MMMMTIVMTLMMIQATEKPDASTECHNLSEMAVLKAASLGMRMAVLCATLPVIQVQ